MAAKEGCDASQLDAELHSWRSTFSATLAFSWREGGSSVLTVVSAVKAPRAWLAEGAFASRLAEGPPASGLNRSVRRRAGLLGAIVDSASAHRRSRE